MDWFKGWIVQDSDPSPWGNRGNVAFVDGQNLVLGTREQGWSVDWLRFKKYLTEKYKVKEVYYFFGYEKRELQNLYNTLRNAGFKPVFKEHRKESLSEKRGNIDVDLVFEVLHKLLEEPDAFEKVVIVSGDGDYIKLVKYLIEKNRFEKILFPNEKKCSSLYKQLGDQWHAGIEKSRKLLEYKKR